ncbi:uncharacterized protein LOC135686279 [Rhopilema esculentum]|uniref:uncharacterized protein LOC135686279 n=1 Tax=Rhopilema esculentum TaxID=499914 RepID=UPI0031DAB872|eukprot:gene605-10299_t
MEESKDIKSALKDAIERIERLEQQGSANTVENAVPSAVRPPRPFLPMRRGVVPHTTSLIDTSRRPNIEGNREEAVMQDFRRAFPSLGCGGSRQATTSRRKGKSQQYVFIKPKETWTRDFCLLAEPTEGKTPCTARLLKLKEAGIGKRKVRFDDKNASHGKVRQVLETVYPKLKSQAGAFEMLRADRGGTNCDLNIIPMSPNGYNLQHLKESVGGNTIIYVRPMQSSLSLSKVTTATDDAIRSKCRYCHTEVPLMNMRKHLEECMAGAGASSAEDPIRDVEDSSSDEEVSGKNEDENGESRNGSWKWGYVAKEKAKKDEWKDTLKQMFPEHSTSQISLAVIGISSIEEAVSELLETPSEEASTNKRRKFSSNPSFETLLEEFRKNTVLPEYEDIKIDRDSLWLDVLRFYKKKVNDIGSLKKSLEVSFKNEEGLDGGTLKIEYFNLAWDEIKKRLFVGNMTSLLPIKDSTKIFLFRLAGILLVHTIVQNGPIAVFPKLAKPIILSILGKDTAEIMSQLNKHDIPMCSSTEILLNLIEELDDAKSKAAIDFILENGQRSETYWQVINASHWPSTEPITVNNKNILIQELVYNETVRSRLDVITEFKKGLETLGFFPFISKHEHCFFELLHKKKQPFEPEFFKSLLEVDDPKSHAEKQAFNWFEMFISEGMTRLSKDDGATRIEALLQFATSWCTPEKLGIAEKIKVEFLPDDDEHTLPASIKGKI